MDFEKRNAASTKRLTEDIANISIRLNQRYDELSKIFDKWFKSMQWHVDASINNVVMKFNKQIEKDIAQQVDYFDNMT